MYPIAISPTQVHSRMAVQRGYFTIHGSDKRSLVAQFENHQFSAEGRLQKLVIRNHAKSPIWKQLWNAGFRHTNLFPDLDGLATELRSTFGPQP